MKVRIQSGGINRVRGVLQATHRLLLVAGMSLAAWPVFVEAESAYAQWSGERELSRAETQETIIIPKPGSPAVPLRYTRGAVIGRFELPRLNLSYVLLEGTDHRTLDRSIGHIEGTGHIGESGNIGIAGHRNTHFRKLEWVRRGDEIILTSKNGEAARYLVEWARLFHPEDVQVLDPSQGPAVTLITCYPFEYVGSAPLRFVVRALPAQPAP